MSRFAAMLDAYDKETRTLVNKTLTSPTINTPTINSPTYAGATTIAAPTITGTVAGSATYTTPVLDQPTFTAHAIDVPAASTVGTVAIVDLSSTQTLTTKTLTAPVLGGTVTGTYTLGGTPTISGPTITSPVITGVGQKGGAAGTSGAVSTTTKVLTAMADNSNVDSFTVTVPNGIHGGAVRVIVCGTLGDGDSTDSKIYMVGVSRITGANAKAVISTATAVGATTGATANATVTASISSIVGAGGASNTFTIQVKVARSGGAAANHVAVVVAELLNGFATGITIA